MICFIFPIPISAMYFQRKSEWPPCPKAMCGSPSFGLEQKMARKQKGSHIQSDTQKRKKPKQTTQCTGQVLERCQNYS